MSAETLKAIEEAITAHLEEIRVAQDIPEGEFVTNWIAVVELSKFMEDGVVGYRNEYIASMFSPNGQVGLLQYGLDEIGSVMLDSDFYAERWVGEDDDEDDE